MACADRKAVNESIARFRNVIRESRSSRELSGLNEDANGTRRATVRNVGESPLLNEQDQSGKGSKPQYVNEDQKRQAAMANRLISRV